MDEKQLLAFSRRLHDVATRGGILLGTEIEELRRKQGVDAPDSLQHALNQLDESNRLLNVGIVGRVKAGKSSLLNALIFDGRPVLPKAATPMTAALTTLAYGREFSARVEFYGKSDLAQIQERAREYSERLREKANQFQEEAIRRRRDQSARGGPPLDVDAVREQATRHANNEMKREPGLFAAHDQTERMNASGIAPSSLEQEKRIDASGPEDLARELADYVGANGPYMPFTKAVHVEMPLEQLKDVRVIDTPGMNDPVQSREERTVELLKTCDVVFIVSPAGQFLSEQDLEVMGRITSREGVQELVLVASQVDMQLYGSEKRARLDDALDTVRAELAKRADQVLVQLKRANPEVGSVFEGLRTSVGTNLLHSSGVAHALSRTLDRSDGWDSNEKKTWENLAFHYPDYFSADDPDAARRHLGSLANTQAIEGKLAEVRASKDRITREKIVKLVESKSRGLELFRSGLAELAERRIAVVTSADIGDLERQRKALESKRKKLVGPVDFSYKGCMLDYRTKLGDTLRKTADALLGAASEKVEQAGDAKEVSRTREKSGAGNWIARKLWGGGSESYTETVHSVMTGQVASAIQRFIRDVEIQLSNEAERSRYELDKALGRAITPEIHKVLEDDCDVDMIAAAILAIARGLPAEPFELGIVLPEDLKACGTLKGSKAETYKDDAANFLSDLGDKVSRRLKAFVRDIEKSEPATISSSFVDDLKGKIDALKEQVANITATVDQLQRLATQSRAAKP